MHKERVEVFSAAGAGALDDFRLLDLHREGRLDQQKQHRDKGHSGELKAFLQACKSGTAAHDAADVFHVSRTTLALRDAVGG